MEAKLVKEYNDLLYQYKQLIMLSSFNRGGNQTMLKAMDEKLTKMKAEILALRAAAQTSSAPS